MDDESGVNRVKFIINFGQRSKASSNARFTPRLPQIGGVEHQAIFALRFAKHPEQFRISERYDARLAILGLLSFENDQSVVVAVRPLNL